MDRTYWKEIDYIEISQNYWKGGFDFLSPEISWPADPPRVTAMEFPLVPFAAALLYSVLGFGTFAARAVPLGSWVIVSIYSGRLARLEYGPLVGGCSAMVAVILPLFHPLRNNLLSEPTMIAFSVMAVFYLARWLGKGIPSARSAGTACLSLAIALKLTPIYLMLPVSALVLAHRTGSRVRLATFGRIVIPALVLPATWFTWAYFLGRRHIDVFGIFGGHNKLQTFRMLGDPIWRETMAERILWEIFGGKILFGFALLGLLYALAALNNKKVSYSRLSCCGFDLLCDCSRGKPRWSLSSSYIGACSFNLGGDRDHQCWNCGCRNTEMADGWELG